MHRACLLAAALACAQTEVATAKEVRPRHPRSAFRAIAVLRGGQSTSAVLTVPWLSLAAVRTAVDTFYRTAPYTAAFVTCGVKAGCSDALAQTAVERQPIINWPRNLAFILYGGGYQGCVQYFLFNNVMVRLFGEGVDLKTVASKVAFDQLVLTPFLCLPAAYLVKAAIFRKPLPKALSRYVSDARRDLLIKYWLIWTPAQFLTFGVVPPHLRIAFVALVSFFWLIILSTISSRQN